MTDVTLQQVKAKTRHPIFPNLVIPDGLTFEDLERGGDMVFAWARHDDEFAGDFRGLMLVARVFEYLRAAASVRRGAA
jgi:hypothetical protein